MIATPSTPIIEVHDLVNIMKGQKVHDRLNFSLYPNEIVGIVGGSGSGKSVLMRSIIGLQRPTSGSIKIGNKEVTSMNKRQMLAVQRLWGVLFQNGALFSSMTIGENVAFPIREFAGVSEKEAKTLAEIKIELVGLQPEARNKYPAELSGGMVKRAGLARALALDPRILFLDEPTAGLDPISAASFDNLLRELTNDLGLAVAIITHDLDSLFTICDRVAVLVDKKLTLGTIGELQQSEHPWIKEYFHGQRAEHFLRG